ncbi:potassium channel family protein [soil metagenome]
MNGYSRNKNLIVLVAMMLLLVGYPLIQEHIGSRLLLLILRTIVFLMVLQVSFSYHHLRWVALVLAIGALVGAWARHTVTGLSAQDGAYLFHTSAALFQTLIVAVMLRSVLKSKDVTVNSIAAALSGYLFMGVVFGHVYTIIETQSPGSFAGCAAVTDDRRHALLSYFSFVTLTTVGYGDITPLSDPARSLATCEAVLGQFYMAVLIAGLIGKWMGQARAMPPE